ncbi:hypothetical protein ACFPRL_15910 [Pseudoclavibacter helvolus]
MVVARRVDDVGRDAQQEAEDPPAERARQGDHPEAVGREGELVAERREGEELSRR